MPLRQNYLHNAYSVGATHLRTFMLIPGHKFLQTNAGSRAQISLKLCWFQGTNFSRLMLIPGHKFLQTYADSWAILYACTLPFSTYFWLATGSVRRRLCGAWSLSISSTPSGGGPKPPPPGDSSRYTYYKQNKSVQVSH